MMIRNTNIKIGHSLFKLLPPKILVVSLAGLLFGNIACSNVFLPTPYIPMGYYDCIEVNPGQLVDLYFNTQETTPWEKSLVEGAYNSKVFIFKDTIVDSQTLRDSDKGWIWVDIVRCKVINQHYLNYFKAGDHIDIVGINKGYSEDGEPGLIFQDCVVMEAGTIKLPLEADGGLIFYGY